MGRLVHFAPSESKNSKSTGKTRSSLSEDAFRKVLTGQKKSHGNIADTSKSPWKEKNELGSATALQEALNEFHSSSPGNSSDTASDDGDEDWLSSSNVLAQYDDADSATEEERTVALLEELQVTFQANAIQIKRDLCSSILTTLNDIRQTHVSVDRGPDVDRGKGIVIFNSSCEKQHTDAQRLQAELEDDLVERQGEMKRIFGQLKQCYATREQLWADFEAKVLQITNKQTEILERCEKETAETIANFDQKYGPMLKEDTMKSKEKLLRDVLDKM